MGKVRAAANGRCMERGERERKENSANRRRVGRHNIPYREFCRDCLINYHRLHVPTYEKGNYGETKTSFCYRFLYNSPLESFFFHTLSFPFYAPLLIISSLCLSFQTVKTYFRVGDRPRDVPQPKSLLLAISHSVIFHPLKLTTHKGLYR